MAVQLNSYKDKQQNQRRFYGGGGNKGKLFLRALIGIIAAIFIILCLFGVINQRQLVEGVSKESQNTGNEIGEELYHVLDGDDQSPFSITDQGIYLKGHEPANSKDIIQEKNAEQLEKEAEEAQKEAEKEYNNESSNNDDNNK